MSDIFLAKQRLPLPALMHRLGLGEHATKSARCPFHDDKHNSFSVYRNNNGELRWNCFAGCGQGDEITFLEKHHGISNKEATKLFLEMAGVKEKEPNEQTFNWCLCVDAFTDRHVEKVAEWRGYKPEFVKELRDNGQIGIYNGLVAFPVQGDGKIVGAHYRLKNGEWAYAPRGIKTVPLVFGKLQPDRNQVFESTWDGLDYMDKSGERDGVIIARGSTNAKLAAALIPQGSTAYVFTQTTSRVPSLKRRLCPPRHAV